MSLRSARKLLGLLLLGAVTAAGGTAAQRGDASAGAAELHAAADIAESNAPHEDAAATLRRVGAPMRAPRLDGLAGGGDDRPQPSACCAARTPAHRRQAASAGPGHAVQHGEAGPEPARADAPRAPPSRYLAR